MFTLIGLVLGAFLGYLASGFIGGLQPLRETGQQLIRKGTDAIGSMIAGLTKSSGYGPMINIGIVVLLVIFLLWFISFSTALLLGIIAGVIYTEDIGRLPFVSGIADTIKSKIAGLSKPSSKQ